jgi:hypothetical protein
VVLEPGAGAELLCGGPLPGRHEAGGGSVMKVPMFMFASSMLVHGFAIMKPSLLIPHWPSGVQQLAISKSITITRAHCGSESGIMRHLSGSFIIEPPIIDIGAIPLVPHSPSGEQHNEMDAPAAVA